AAGAGGLLPDHLDPGAVRSDRPAHSVQSDGLTPRTVEDGRRRTVSGRLVAIRTHRSHSFLSFPPAGGIDAAGQLLSPICCGTDAFRNDVRTAQLSSSPLAGVRPPRGEARPRG